MELVIDTAAVLAVVLNEPERGALIAATRGAVLFAPASLPWEVGNALVAAVRRRRLSRDAALLAWKSYRKIALRLVALDIGRAIALATERGIYAYDAYMLELARSRGLPLLTLDTRLRSVARAAGVELVEIGDQP
ncbi:MAG: twitching motility protein PilT [Candidatus Binatia bacterium]|nr:MAG: twitching motility protein PilT [Candidatus Binatia bacterium]